MPWPLEIVLPGPPRGKARPRRAPNGTHVYTDAAARTYEAQLRYAAAQAMRREPPTESPVRVEVELRFPIAASWSKKKQAAAECGALRPCRKPDADNGLKLVDCCNGVVFLDDQQVVEAVVRKVYSRRPGLTITVYRLDVGDALTIDQQLGEAWRR